ncbi:hypothetical protein ACRE_064430 [Hapsidospora chrysogenum ATCC 11550]|uniref:Sialidase-like protein n=1 Tax=Hapsidospora chrysogenum (strain ATCC 11550 / CBS 779.69 / DSM 880 / IAM 14645 / JCM 23072 / IMI 49137) TaxID=857340 RepID=A0A086T0E5_HAPC1|nr:hypothetical protein ACRE_064430 [Hapsidospora chrysogenum ATCC 11550]
MSALAADMSLDFGAYPYASVEQPSTPSPHMPSMDFSFDPAALFDLDMSAAAAGYQHYTATTTTTTPQQQQQQQQQLQPPTRRHHNHTRSSSRASVYSAVSTVESTPDSVSTGLTTPPRASPPVRHHGPILLPKIRSQDQDLDSAPTIRRRHRAAVHKATPPPAPRAVKAVRSSHARSYTNPETLNSMAFAHMAFSTPQPSADDLQNSLLCSPASFAHDVSRSDDHHSRRSSSAEAASVDKYYAFTNYRQMTPFQHQDFTFPSAYNPRAPSPLSMAAAATASVTPDPTPSTTLAAFLTSPNPAASLVRTISFPHRDPNIKHFWWDVRSVRSWTGFNAEAVLALPGARGLLAAPVPEPALPQPAMSARHPETEAALHAIYASYYLPKLNSALALSSARPLQLSVPSSSSPAKPGSTSNDLLFTVNPVGQSSTANAIFGGKPTARVVGLVRTFDRFNTGMRAEGNIKRVEYLRGLSALHYAMREHGCRYGFILTEIEIVLVRAGTDATPYFGDLEVTSVQLAASAASPEDLDLDPEHGDPEAAGVPLTACLALWGLCQLANDRAAPGQAHWKAEIGAPAEGTRRKAKARDGWMPAPQLAEKREAKRSRGWIWPEDPVGRKELGKRGVRYNGI